MRWWPRQAEIARALLEHRRVFVKASHAVGKTFLAAGLVNWFFDTHDPSVTLTTAPTAQQVYDVLWKEVRAQRRGRPGLQPKAPRMETRAEHFAVGYTASTGTSFQGRHEEALLGIFDEATGVDAAFWEGMEGMMTGPLAYWLCIMNPTDTASRAYEEELRGDWHVITVSALEHPNITAELEGRPAPFPAAVRLAWVRDRVAEWCEPIPAGDRRAGDVEWPPASGQWQRPGPLFESRVLGRWPTQGATSVWTEAAWEATQKQLPIPQNGTEWGVDVARFGDDNTSFVGRRGACALHHETHNGWSTMQTVGRAKQLAREYAQPGEDPKTVRIKVDDDGVGGGVTDRLREDGWAVEPMSGASSALDPDSYPNQRSAVWFVVAERANKGRMDLTRLSEQSRTLLRRQLMAPTWKLDSAGRRVVEPKADTKKRLGRSPDDADALNMAYAPRKAGTVEIVARRRGMAWH